TWDSPKGLSTHMPANVTFANGYAILSLTTDAATGAAGAAPMDPEGGGPVDAPTGGSDGAGGSAPGSGGGAPASGAGGTTGEPGAGGNGSTPGPDGGGNSMPSGGQAGVDPGVTGGNAGTPQNGSSSGGGCSVGSGNARTPWGALVMALGLTVAWVRRRRSQVMGS